MKKIRRNDLPSSSLPEDRAQAAQLTSDIRSELARVADAQSALHPVVQDLYDEMIRSRQSFENTSGETTATSRELVTVTTTLTQAAERLTAAVQDLTEILREGANPPPSLVGGASDSAPSDKSLHRPAPDADPGTRSGEGSPTSPGDPA